MSESSDTSDGAGRANPRGPGEVQLCIVIPQTVRAAVRAAAKHEGVTVRTFVLRALQLAGVDAVKDEELVDRRAVIAALKAKLLRAARDSDNTE